MQLLQERAYRACPFNCAASGAQFVCKPPDGLETNAHAQAFLVECLQSRKSAGWSAPQKVVPSGLAPPDHFEYGLHAKSPFDHNRAIPFDLEFAVNKICELRGDIEQWREEQFERMKGFVTEAAFSPKHFTQIDPRVPPSVLPTSPQQQIRS